MENINEELRQEAINALSTIVKLEVENSRIIDTIIECLVRDILNKDESLIDDLIIYYKGKDMTTASDKMKKVRLSLGKTLSLIKDSVKHHLPYFEMKQEEKKGQSTENAEDEAKRNVSGINIIPGCLPVLNVSFDDIINANGTSDV